MKLSDIRKQIDSIMATEGDIDLGDPRKVSFLFQEEGWVGGWGIQVVMTGLQWATGPGVDDDHFIGIETLRCRKAGTDPRYCPADDDLTEPVTKAVKR